MANLNYIVAAILLSGLCFGQNLDELPGAKKDNTNTTSTTSTTTTPKTTTTATTTAPPHTTTPLPKVNFYSYTENNVTCLMLAGDIAFDITYELSNKKTTNSTKVKVPSANGPSPGVANGTCSGESGTQTLSVSWGEESTASSITLTFNSTKTNWRLVEFAASIYMDNKTFPNSTTSGKFLDMNIVAKEFSEFNVSHNMSYQCHSSFQTRNVTGSVNNTQFNQHIVATFAGLKMQAYNTIPHQMKFNMAEYCLIDKTSDIVPIAVGCALAGLVLIVLIAYLVGRRRRSAAYQSV